MSDDLPRRMTDNQLNNARARVAMDADRLAARTAQFAADIRTGGGATAAWQIAQDAIDLLRQAARLDGMTDIANLIPPKETP